ncbi:MAG: hypothetical protein AB7N76_24135 [Planctomycetota bacterium]
MLIGRRDERWVIAVLTAGLLIMAFYRLFPHRPDLPLPLTPFGLLAGCAAAAIVAFCAALGLRRRLLGLPAGPLSGWLRAHVWVGLLCWPLALVHADYRPGGALTTALLVTLGVVLASGVLGVVLQSRIPARMRDELAREHPYAALPAARAALALRAHGAVAPRCAPLPEALDLLEAAGGVALASAPRAERTRAGKELFAACAQADAANPDAARLLGPLGLVLRATPEDGRRGQLRDALAAAAAARAPLCSLEPLAPLYRAVVQAASEPLPAALACLKSLGGRADAEVISALRALLRAELSPSDAAELDAAPSPPARAADAAQPPPRPTDPALRALYLQAFLPFCAAGTGPLATDVGARAHLAAARHALPPESQEAVEELELCVGELRATQRQERLARWLEAWTLLHYPAAYALVVLTAAHTLAALYW